MLLIEDHLVDPEECNVLAKLMALLSECLIFSGTILQPYFYNCFFVYGVLCFFAPISCMILTTRLIFLSTLSDRMASFAASACILKILVCIPHEF